MPPSSRHSSKLRTWREEVISKVMKVSRLGEVKVSRLCELKVSAPGVVKKGRIDKEGRRLRPEKMRRERREVAIVQGSQDGKGQEQKHQCRERMGG
jgi:hypothetical protein